MADYPSNFQYHPDETPPAISFEGVVGATEYWIESDDGTHGFQKVYQGPDTEFPLILAPGEYGFKGKAKKNLPWGPYGPVEIIKVI